ncbi:MAG: TIM barrel protein [Anaerolineae bacterium]
MIKQSFSWDGFARTGVEPRRLIRAAADIGYAGIDLVPQDFWQPTKDAGLKIVCIVGHPLSPAGLNKREHLPAIEASIRANLELAARWEIPHLICFSGNRYGLDETAAAEITAEHLRRLGALAGSYGVTLILELLNSKVKDRDYQADHTAWAAQVCRMVDLPHVKLLYDIYHMQIMEGDIINTVRQNHAHIAHYHTAGNPGRADLDEAQELNYPAIVRAIKETGYDGFIGHEFFPKGDAVAALKAAFEVCNV